MKTHLTPAQLVLIPTLVGLNLVLGWIVSAVKFPIYLDNIGITVGAILAGPLVATIVAVATTLLGTALFSPVLWAFTGTAVLIGLLSSFLAKRGFYVVWWKAIIAGLIIAVGAAIVSAPVSAIMFGGATGGGVDALTLLFRKSGSNVIESVFKSGFASEPVDKVIASLIAFGLVHSLSRRTVAWLPGAAERIWGANPK